MEGARLRCPITAIGAVDDGEVPRELLAPWQEYTSGAFALRMFPGNHFFLRANRASLLQTLAEQLQAPQRVP